MRLAAGILVAVSACYAPTVPAGAPCDPQLDNCPAGQRCEMTATGAYCGAIASTDDGGTSDTRIDSAPGCFGTGLVTNVCLMPPPTNDVIVSANRAINTAMVGGGNCDQIIAQPFGGPSMCMVVGKTITIAQGVTLTAQGPNPLLVVATETLDVAGTVDVASHPGVPNPGAGSDMTCASNPGMNGSGSDGAGGGGAGGTFGTMGGAGGSGRNGGSGGMAIATMTPGTLRGGCRGGTGGAGSGGGFGGPGLGGAGGGGVYLLAGSSITISGSINASGAPGGGGLDSTNAGAGGGGGGSGGMIALDAPTIAVNGSLFANGGGGGGGNGSDVDRPGSAGGECTSATVPANGGPGGNGGGGNGGRGYALSLNAANGANGSSQYCAGGGGGGGAGVIKVFGGPVPSAIGGTISPPAT